MKILVSGGTGFIGRSLIPALLLDKHKITVIGRQVKKINDLFKSDVSPLPWDKLNEISPDSFDAVINLAGENIAQNRWTARSKKTIKESRLHSTRKLVQWCLKSKNKKIHLYNASAISIYGNQKSIPVGLQDAILGAEVTRDLNFLNLKNLKEYPGYFEGFSGSENSKVDIRSDAQSRILKSDGYINGLPTKITESSLINPEKENNFLHEIAQSWENEAKPLIDSNLPVTFMRFAVVLKRNQGILKKLEMPFSLGLGTILGDGNQPYSWISIDDLVNAILFLINRPEITGPINMSSPMTVSQKIFAKTLSHIMQRPCFLKLPSILVKILFGQMGEELLLSGQNVYPQRLKQLGFEFQYPDLDSALKHEWIQK